jgi:surfactin synthase thioesterase subunit
VRLPMPPFGDSITFVVARHLRRELGSPRQLIVNISSSPSRRLAAAEVYACSSHAA